MPALVYSGNQFVYVHIQKLILLMLDTDDDTDDDACSSDEEICAFSTNRSRYDSSDSDSELLCSFSLPPENRVRHLGEPDDDSSEGDCSSDSDCLLVSVVVDVPGQPQDCVESACPESSDDEEILVSCVVPPHLDDEVDDSSDSDDLLQAVVVEDPADRPLQVLESEPARDPAESSEDEEVLVSFDSNRSPAEEKLQVEREMKRLRKRVCNLTWTFHLYSNQSTFLSGDR